MLAAIEEPSLSLSVQVLYLEKENPVVVETTTRFSVFTAP